MPLSERFTLSTSSACCSMVSCGGRSESALLRDRDGHAGFRDRIHAALMMGTLSTMSCELCLRTDFGGTTSDRPGISKTSSNVRASGREVNHENLLLCMTILEAACRRGKCSASAEDPATCNQCGDEFVGGRRGKADTLPLARLRYYGGDAKEVETSA